MFWIGTHIVSLTQAPGGEKKIMRGSQKKKKKKKDAERERGGGRELSKEKDEGN